MTRLHAAVLALAALTVPLAGVGCTTHAAVQGELVYGQPAVYVSTVPANVYHYPRVVYGDSHAYLVNERWYYPSSRGWVVFRQEPRELRSYRVYYRTHRTFPTYARPAPTYRRPAPAPVYRQGEERYRYREPAYGTPSTQRRYYVPR